MKRPAFAPGVSSGAILISMRDASFHQATLDSIRRRLPHIERYRLVLAALLTFALANDESAELGYRLFQLAMATLCFVAIAWFLIDYLSARVRIGVGVVAWVLVFAPAVDRSSDLDPRLGFAAFVAAATAGALTGLIERNREPSPTAVSTHALRELRGQA